MTTGAVIFAFNNGEFDYVKLAAAAAMRLRRHLDIPTCVITDSEQVPSVFDHVVKVERPAAGHRFFDDLGSNADWYNTNRYDAWRLTPWQKTLLIDADYVVASSNLKPLLDTNQPLLCHAQARDVSGQGFLEGSNTFGSHRMPCWWATVMIFDKSSISRQIFECMHMVRTNWNHYCELYNIGRSTYRNDWALSIAIGIMSGHTWRWPSVPWPLATVMPRHVVTTLEPDTFEIKFVDQQQRPKRLVISGQDFHVLGKKNLGDIVEPTS